MKYVFVFRNLLHVCKVKPTNASVHSKSQTENTIYLTPQSSGSTSGLRSFKSLNEKSLTKSETRRFSRLGSQTQFESIDEDIEQPTTKTDSGVQSVTSRHSVQPMDTFYSISTNSTTAALFERMSVHQQQSQTTLQPQSPQRHIPKTLSFVAGIFLFKIFDSKHQTERLAFNVAETDNPLISLTIAQPSFMITQNIYDSIVNFSIINLSVNLPVTDGTKHCVASNLFPENVIATMTMEICHIQYITLSI